MIVTSLQRQRRRALVDVYVDGELAVKLHRDIVAEHGIRPGRTTSQDELARLAEADEKRAALESALRLLSHRPRGERELRDRLARKGVGRQAADETVARLRELGYLDDAAFACFWAETRQQLSPRSARALAVELRRKGIEPETAVEAIAGISDEEAALEAARRRLKSLRRRPYGEFRERLGRFLTGRGFSYEVARRTVDACWAELAD